MAETTTRPTLSEIEKALRANIADALDKAFACGEWDQHHGDLTYEEASAELASAKALVQNGVDALMAEVRAANERAAELAEAWHRYGEASTISDGHAKGCTPFPSGCTCGFSRVERAIRVIVRAIPSEGERP